MVKTVQNCRPLAVESIFGSVEVGKAKTAGHSARKSRRADGQTSATDPKNAAEQSKRDANRAKYPNTKTDPACIATNAARKAKKDEIYDRAMELLNEGDPKKMLRSTIASMATAILETKFDCLDGKTIVEYVRTNAHAWAACGLRVRARCTLPRFMHTGARHVCMVHMHVRARPT